VHRSKVFQVTVLLIGLAATSYGAQSSASTESSGLDGENHQNEAVRLLQEYLRIDTSNPPGNEIKAAEFFKKFFDRENIPNTIYRYGNGRANIVAVLKGDGSGRPLILLNHLDTVRANPPDWRVPPFGGEILNRELWGRGALDMKNLAIAQAMAMALLARNHVTVRRNILFLGTADEEVNDSGADWMIANHPELFQNAEFLLTEGGPALQYPSGMLLYEIGVGEKAPFWLKMTATGTGGHGSVPLHDSAPNRLARGMARVADWQRPVRLLPFVEEYFRSIANLESGTRSTEFQNIAAALKDGPFAHSLGNDPQYGWMLRDTVSLTVIRSGEQLNVIPDHAYCELDVRLLPGTNPQEFLQAIEKVVDDSEITIEPILKFRPPNSSDTSSSLYRMMEQVIHEHAPRALIAPFLNHGFTESQMFRALGIKSYGWNPFVLSAQLERTKHAANERIPVEQFQDGVRVFCEVVQKVAESH
jgi:acetylornithine deacetylase/succinyl-diaminopimelate desuccinylase-like protein